MRRGWPVLATGTFGLLLCAAGVLAGAASAGPVYGAGGLPGPAPGCPGQPGIPAPRTVPWAQQALGFSSVWNLTRGAGVTVAVVDSGVDADPQFGNRVTLGPDLAREVSGVPGDADCAGHGTFVASIIAAAPVAGVAFFTGVAPAARILSVKVTNSDNPGSIRSQVVSHAILDAVKLGARVINLSLVVPNTAQLRSAVEFALDQNVVVVAAAGNDLKGGGAGPFYPAAYPGVLSVGAAAQDGPWPDFPTSARRSR